MSAALTVEFLLGVTESAHTQSYSEQFRTHRHWRTVSSSLSRIKHKCSFIAVLKDAWTRTKLVNEQRIELEFLPIKKYKKGEELIGLVPNGYLKAFTKNAAAMFARDFILVTTNRSLISRVWQPTQRVVTLISNCKGFHAGHHKQVPDTTSLNTNCKGLHAGHHKQVSNSTSRPMNNNLGILLLSGWTLGGVDAPWCTLCLVAFQMKATVGDLSSCCCVTSFEH